ncbi:class I SAM-dependent methyltransferase [Geothrix paludis]|uniref:class I SAM-dependent methyltransferase n=1 Tax=Geothrix paludis TaxID=2922722 RepID=UPI003C2B224C
MDSVIARLSRPKTGAPQWIDPILFAGKALSRPRRIGAVLPSGAPLAKVMTRMVNGQTVVELGPGSGSITRHLLNSLPPTGRLLALELDPDLARRLQHHVRDTRLVIRTGDAAGLEDCLQALGWSPVDAVVSGIPFQALPVSSRDRILSAARSGLAPGGRFIAFQYGLRLIPLFQNHFRRVHVLGPVWRNLPPAYVIVGLP